MQIINFRDARKISQLYLHSAQNELLGLLKAALKQDGSVITNVDNNRISLIGVQGNDSVENVHVKNKNDRSDYFWIRFQILKANDKKTIEKEYWLTLFYNEIDAKRGNFHTQVGRIQFWKGIEESKTTPNERVSKKPTEWKMRLDNACQLKEPIFIGSNNYCPKTVVEQFLKFINNDIQRKEAKI